MCGSQFLQMLKAYLFLMLKVEATALRYVDEKGREKEGERGGSNQIKEN